jgi:Carbohydrate binding domain
MKKITVLALSIVLLSTTAFTGETDGNLIKNGSFEIVNNKGKISNWGTADWNKKEERGILTIKQVDDATDGKKAAQINSTVGKGNLLIFQNFKKTAGVEKKYKVTLKFKGPVGGDVYTSLYALAPKDKKIKPQYEHSKKIKGSNDWQELTASYTIKSEYNSVKIYVRCTKTPVIVDDVKVVEVTK